jgi:YbbR domain-containing protein
VAKLIKILFSNFAYKVIAILLSVVFWYIVQSEQVLEISRKVRVQLIPPEGFVVKGGNTQFKEALLRGPRALLSHYPMEPIVAQIRLFTDKPQNVRTRVDREDIRAWNDRIKITIYDAYISVFLDKKVEKELSVKQNFMGVPKEGLVIEKVTISPENVVITGAATELQKLDSISTDLIDINGISSSKTFDVALMINDLVMKSAPKKVQVSLFISEKKINKAFENIPIEIEGATHGVKLTPAKISVVIQGSLGHINSVKAGDIKAFLNVKDLHVGTHYEQKIQIKIPNDFVLVESLPEKATVEIINKKRGL